MLSFDTNILVYASDRRAGDRHIEAVRIVGAAKWVQAALSEQSLLEFMSAALRKQNQPLADAAGLVQAWLNNFPLMPTPATIIDETVSLLKSFRLSVWDARMLAVCAANACDVLLSEDLADGTLYKSVRVVNPFNPKNASAIAELLQL